MMVALGIRCDGRKTVLELREGGSENATVVSEPLSDLAARGLDFRVPRLYVVGRNLSAPRIAGSHRDKEFRVN